jgi:uncharacterized protein YyaL (SSP411 family)
VQLNDTQLLAAAKNEADFIRERLLLPDGTLRRVAGRPVAGVPEDYAFVISALKEYEAHSKDPKAAALGASLLSALNAEYWDNAAGRYLIVGRAPSPAFWARVVSPAPLPADLPSAEATLLTVLQKDPQSGGANANQVSALRGAVAQQARNAEEVARGDWLLCLGGAQK